MTEAIFFGLRELVKNFLRAVLPTNTGQDLPIMAATDWALSTDHPEVIAPLPPLPC
jgi:hypothetical protein